jgi:hypothetical protein
VDTSNPAHDFKSLCVCVCVWLHWVFIEVYGLSLVAVQGLLVAVCGLSSATAYGILVPQPGIKCLQRKHGVLSPGLLGKSLSLSYLRTYVEQVKWSHSVVSDSLRPHELQQARTPCPSLRVHPNSCPSSRWYHPAIVPFSSCPQSLPASYYIITNYIKGDAHLIKSWFIKLFTYYFKYYLSATLNKANGI